MSKDSALIFDIYRGTSHDGPGQRDTVFFKDCPLSCKWCHNPEGISAEPLVWWQSRQCIGCLICHNTCKHGANIAAEDGIHIDRSKCVRCGECVKACPSQALSMCGERRGLDGLIEELLKDKVYYSQTSGGVTASGGEAMLQYEFVSEMFKRLHEKGISTALDTCGYAPREHFEKILPHTDYILYDLKLIDSEQHKHFTGVNNELILENISWISKKIRDKELNCELWIRTPLIPDATATVDNLQGIGKFIADELGEAAVARWELCAFNNSCITKYQRLDKAWSYEKYHALKKHRAEELRMAASAGGFDGDKIFVTGILSD